jgi:tripartite-type tricarboxylate transporter receptor subunit TctC
MRHFLGLLVAALAAALLASAPCAELLSARPISVIIPFTPGASADTLQRILNKKVTEETGQVLVVESRPGGGGAIAATAVKQAQPDGHTLFQANSATHAANATLYPALPYDPVKDFRPITLMWSFPQLLAVPRDSPAKSVGDLVALASSRPGGLSFASQGSGSSGHLLGEMLKARAGANMVHIPYRGAVPAALDLAAGRVDFFFVSYSSLLPFLQAGSVRVVAVTSPEPLPLLPQVPTLRQAGFDGIMLDAWFGLVAPSNTPQAAIAKLNAAFVTALKHADVVRQITEQGAQARASTPAEFAVFIASETERIGAIVHAVGARGE